MLFSKKGGILSRQEKWTYAGETVEIVNSFNYLGIVLSSGGAFIKATNTLVGKALKSMNALFAITKSMQVPTDVMFNLFDSFVLSILNYGCEVWGFSTAQNVERVHRKFCKWLINVKMSTNNLSLAAEFGRFPLIISRQVRIIKYWLNLHSIKSENCILNTLNLMLRNEVENNPNIVSWSSKVKNLLQHSGFADVWLYPESVDIKKFIPMFHCRLKDIYITDWKQSIDLSSSLVMYREMKTIFEISPYLLIVRSKKFRNAIAKLRLSSHHLNIEIGRHRNIERLERKCELCDKNDLEDEYHFTIICPVYSDIRKQYIQKYYYIRPSVIKFITLMNSTNRKTLNNLALYIIKAFQLRNSLMNEFT